jgi:hypothetical protein
VPNIFCQFKRRRWKGTVNPKMAKFDPVIMYYHQSDKFYGKVVIHRANNGTASAQK